MQKAKRWVVRAKQDVILEEFEYDETALKPREIAVRLHFTAVSPGTECANYLAIDPDVLKPDKWCSYPWKPGYAGIGKVIRVGSAVTEYKTGDMVIGMMRHGTHWTMNVDELTAPANPAVKPEHAAYTRIIGISMSALQVLHADPFATVGVWGQGIIGNFAAQILDQAGGRVFGIDPIAERRQLAMKCGIRETLDPSAQSFSKQVGEITQGKGFDVTVDTTGHAPTTLSIPTFTRRRGQMVLLTHWRSQPVLDASDFIYNIFIKGIILHGAHEGAPGSEPDSNWHTLQGRKWAKIQHQLAVGGLNAGPLISHVVKPSQCKEAYEGLSFDRSKWWGVAVDWRD